jgi:uncharacterized protein (DUF1800 family)
MPRLPRPAARRTCAAATLLLLAACGGGEPDETGAAAAAGERRQALAAPGSTPLPIFGAPTTLTVRARGTLAGNVGPQMVVRVDGSPVATIEVRSAQMNDHVVAAPALRAGSKVDIAFTNDARLDGQDRNLFVAYALSGAVTVMPTAPAVVFDAGAGAQAYDGVDTGPGRGELYGNGALRFTWPGAPAADPALAARQAASRFLQQASFGPRPTDITGLLNLDYDAWLSAQMALPYKADFVNHVQAKYNLGDAYRPKGAQYNGQWITQRFWATAATSPDQLRKRVAFALHHVFMVSQADSGLYEHQRAYANYLDKLNQHAFGNFRTLIEEVALSPVTGIYLSHMRNRKEDPTTGRLPDENFARELMQLYTIGLHQLATDGTPQLDAMGKPVETYGNADVMALAKVFTGWSWAFPDGQLTEQNFLWGKPDYATANDQRIDLLKMKPYPGLSSTAEARLFAGRPGAVVIPGNTTPQARVKLALDALFQHPNVGPFIGRQLIQQLVTSHPSPAYVGRVAARFNDNGSGVRGDMAAVVRAILLDPEARAAATATSGKLREPVLRVAHWMRSFDARSASGEFQLPWELDRLSQRPWFAPSVFGYFRPGYVPPNTAFSATGATAPEFQLVNETTTAAWVNLAASMAGSGLGSHGSGRDVASTLSPQVALVSAGNVDGLLQNIDLLLFDGRMSRALRLDLLDAVTSVTGNDAASHLNRARVAVYLALSSSEYLVQR